MWKRLHVKYPLFLSDFNETWVFSTAFRKTELSSFIKGRPVGMDRWAMKLVVAFRNFANTPKKKVHSLHNRPRRPRGGIEVQFYSFFNLRTRCGWVVNATPWPLSLGKETQYASLNWVADGCEVSAVETGVRRVWKWELCVRKLVGGFINPLTARRRDDVALFPAWAVQRHSDASWFISRCSRRWELAVRSRLVLFFCDWLLMVGMGED